MSEVPLDPEPVLGWRAWRLRRGRYGLRLVSLTRDDEWPIRDAMRAECHLPTRHDGVPGAACSCGLYATSEPEHLPLAGITHAEVAVVGPIAMWGRVIEHETGARAEKAYPARLRLVCRTCLLLGRGAVDPVEVSYDGPSLLGACEEHASGGTRVFDAKVVQAELLAAYAVELLPLERVADALRRPPPPKPNPARAVLEGIAKGAFMLLGFVVNAIGAVFAFLWVAFWVFTIGSVAWGVVTNVLGFGEPVAAESSPSLDPEDLPYVLADFPKDDPPLRVVCGTAAGARVEWARCASGEDDVFGFVVLAPPPKGEIPCHPDAISSTRGEEYFICWHPVEGEDPELEPRATAPDPLEI